MQKILVFDFGASSVRAMLCRREENAIVTDEIHRFKNIPIETDGKLCYNTDYLFAEVKKAIKLADKVGFSAVSIDAFGVDYGVIGKDGKLSALPVCRSDERTMGTDDEVFRLVSRESLFNRTGIQSVRINTVFQLYAEMKSDPEKLKNAAAILMIPDLIAWYLTGEMKSEYTVATTSSLVSAATGDWDYELIRLLGLPVHIFMPIIKAGEVYGCLKPEFTDRRIPVIAAPAHDTASAVAAVPVDMEKDKTFAFISCDASALMGTELSQPVTTERAEKLGLTNEGGCFGTTMLLRSIPGTGLLQECRAYYEKKNGSCTFSELQKAAEESECRNAIIDLSDGAFSVSENMPEKIAAQLAAGKAVPNEMGGVARVIYESLAAAFAKTLAAIEELTGKSYPSVYIFGGGSRDEFLCKLTAEKTRRRVIAGPTDAAVLGNAACALIRAGEIDDIRSARMIMNESQSIKEYSPEKRKILAATCMCADFFPESGKIYAGGNSLNLAVGAKKAGAEEAAVMGLIGSDEFGDKVIEKLDEFSLDRSHVYRSGSVTASNKIYIDASGDRYFKPDSWTNGAYGEYKLSAEDRLFLRSFDAVATVIFCPNIEEIAEEKRKNGEFLLTADCLDSEPQDWWKNYFDVIDVLFVSAKENKLDVYRKWSTEYNIIFVATLGSEGSVAFKDGAEFRCKAIPAPQDVIVDTTGCGDSYQGGFITEYLSSRDIARAMQKGSETARETLTFLGGC